MKKKEVLICSTCWFCGVTAPILAAFRLLCEVTKCRVGKSCGHCGGVCWCELVQASCGAPLKLPGKPRWERLKVVSQKEY